MNYKKIISAASVSLIGFAAFAGSAFAAPFTANNPQIVANYPTGIHGIVGEPETHTGADVVMRAGNSGNFQQWFYGNSTEDGGNTEGDHSVWQNVGSAGSCNGNQTLVANAYPNWGDYLQPNVNYCVSTNDFHESH